MKLIDILLTASTNMLQSKLRTFLTVIAIFIGALTLTLTNGIGAGISQYIDRQLGNVGAEDILLIQAGSADEELAPGVSNDGPKKYNPERKTASAGGFGGPAFPVMGKADLEKITAQAGIKEIEVFRSVTPDYIVGPSGDKYEFSVTPHLEGTNLDLATGNLPDNKASQTQVVLPVSYTTVLGFTDNTSAVGKEIAIGITSAQGAQSEVRATIVGVQQKSLLSLGGAAINTPLVDKLYAAQTEGLPMALTEQYPYVSARFDAALTEAEVTKLKDDLKKAGYDAQTVDDQIGIVRQVINGIIMVFNIFGIIALIAASFGVINTLLMAVQERTKEIGLMKAMGMSGNRIFLLFSAEAILLGFWGSLFGVVTAMGIGQVANRYATNSFLKDFEGLNLLAFPWQSIVTIMLLIMAIAFLAGTLPARRAAKLNPIDALRYE